MIKNKQKTRLESIETDIRLLIQVQSMKKLFNEEQRKLAVKWLF